MKRKIAQLCLGVGGLGFVWLAVFAVLTPAPIEICVLGASVTSGLVALILMGLWLQGAFD